MRANHEKVNKDLKKIYVTSGIVDRIAKKTKISQVTSDMTHDHKIENTGNYQVIKEYIFQ